MPKNEKQKIVSKVETGDENDEVIENEDFDEEALPITEGGEIRRRGKRKKGRNRLMSAALITTNQNDPETQVCEKFHLNMLKIKSDNRKFK